MSHSLEIIKESSMNMSNEEISYIKELIKNMDELNGYLLENKFSWFRSPDTSENRKHSIVGVDKYYMLTTKDMYYVFFTNAYVKRYDDLVDKYDDLVNKYNASVELEEARARAFRMLR